MGTYLPQKAREALGLPKRGPLPRSVRYRSQVEATERALVGCMPRAVAVVADLLDDPDRWTRFVAARYILDRTLGKVPVAANALADDHEAPVMVLG